MKFITLSAALPRAWRVLALACLLSAIGGCASDPPTTLTLRSLRQDRTFTQAFSAVYCWRDARGNTDFVLVDHDTQKVLEGGRPVGPVRQIMHIRVLWNPLREANVDQAWTSNATINWYVIGNAGPSDPQIIEYAGTAFISVEDAADGTELAVRRASLRPVAARGNLCDPVGQSSLQGTVRATADRRRTLAALADVRTAVAAASALPNRASSSAKPESPSSAAR